MLLHPDLLLPLVLFSIVSAFTPGPNNMMLLASGLNVGLRRSAGIVVGVALGYTFLVLCVALGLGIVFKAYPIIHMILKYAGGLYLLFLAYKIAKSQPPSPDADRSKKPMHFWHAVAFQWINPKGWVMAISAVATYMSVATYPMNVAIITGLAGVIGAASSASWAGMGTFLQRYLHRPKIVRTFNIVMALLLVASLYPLFTEAAN